MPRVIYKFKCISCGNCERVCKVGCISQLENNLTSPSIATLIDILEILGTNLREFFNEIDNERICFTKDDMFETEDEDLKYTLKWLIPNSQKNEMEPIIITL